MRLAEFFEMYGIAVTRAARIIDCSPQHLMQIADGKVKPSRRLAKDISQYTHGAVSIDDIISYSTSVAAESKRVEL